MTSLKKVIPITWMLFAVLIILLALTSQAIAQEYEDPFIYDAPHERFCVVRAYNLQPTTEDYFDIGCLVDHYARNPGRNATESWEIINVLDIHVATYANPPSNPTLEEQIAFVNANITPIVNAYPAGTIYVLGNEVDRPSIEVNGVEVALQDDELPEDYAVIYHDMYEHIKSLDPTASVVPAGIVQPTALRLEYLDTVVETYQTMYGERMPVDAWHVHNMILNESLAGWGAGIPPGSDANTGLVIDLDQNDDMNLFRQQIVDFRQWMADNGYRDTPLVIYEYGILLPELFGYPEDRVNAFMTATFDYMMTATDDETGYPADDNRLVQQWAWYSLNDQPYSLETRTGFNGNLVNPDTGELTSTGEAFKEYIRADISVESATVVQDGENAVVDIELRNLGIEPVRDATLLVLITDEDNNSRQERIQIVDLFGGENPQSFQVVFDNVSAGVQEITVFADSSSAVEEKSEVNNTAETSITVITAIDARPDITVESVNAVSNDSDGSVTVDIELNNTGVNSVSNAALLVTLTDGNNVVVYTQTVQVSDLLSNEVRPFQVIFDDVSASVQEITVFADSNLEVEEKSEVNNTAETSITVTDIRPDITVESVNAVPNDSDGSVTVDIELNNTGVNSVSNAALLVTLTDDNNVVVYTQTVQVSDLLSNEVRPFQVVFTAVPSGTHTISISADSEAIVAEMSEDNNTFSVPVQIADATAITLSGVTSYSSKNSGLVLVSLLLTLPTIMISRNRQ